MTNFNDTSCKKVLEEVLQERHNQHEQWGEQNLPDGTHPTFVTQRDEHQQRRRGRSNENLLWGDILLEEVYETLSETNHNKLRAELIQVAAVAVQWAEAIDRREKETGA